MSIDSKDATDETRSEFETHLFVFMLAFWPAALVFGLIDYLFITAYDLRILDIVVGAIAGWVAIKVHDKRQAESDE